ncbi:MAG: Rrf2 family transcriptional regulator [Myxococcales bacterium]|nr:Rrf2 family transcriptional regulator [Myxococcales bacterium]
MQHTLQISRKIEYGLRAMLFLAALPRGMVVPLREISRRMGAPGEFLAKILKKLAGAGLVLAARGVRGGYALALPAAEISFLDVIEAVEGPVTVNLCTDPHGQCHFSPGCTMFAVWQLGQEKMLEVYRGTKLDKLAMRDLHEHPATAV